MIGVRSIAKAKPVPGVHELGPPYQPGGLCQRRGLDGDLDPEAAECHGVLAGQAVYHPQPGSGLALHPPERLGYATLQMAVERLDDVDEPRVDLDREMASLVLDLEVDGAVVPGAGDEDGVMPCLTPVAEAKSQMYGESKLVPMSHSLCSAQRWSTSAGSVCMNSSSMGISWP